MLIRASARSTQEADSGGDAEAVSGRVGEEVAVRLGVVDVVPAAAEVAADAGGLLTVTVLDVTVLAVTGLAVTGLAVTVLAVTVLDGATVGDAAATPDGLPEHAVISSTAAAAAAAPAADPRLTGRRVRR